MYKKVISLTALFIICANSSKVEAQWLEAKSEKDDRSISIKVKNGVPSSRVIVSSSFALSYSSNMGDVTNESVGYGTVNGLNTDTLYFYLTPEDDCKRRITISAEGYPPIIVPFVFAPKETHRCFVFDPNKENEEVSSTNNAVQWQFTMAQNFDFGREGFSEDQVEAISWYTKAAEQGHGLSQVTLGVKYASGGNGFSKDLVKSANWFLIAAQQNYDTAQYAIASCFLQGKGVKQDIDKAYYWFQQAADKGIDEARYKMGYMLLDGYGSDQEVDNQLSWFGFFADENRSDAQYMYSRLLLARKPSDANRATAIEYLNKSVALSNVDAMLFLGEICLDENFGQYNVVKGMELLRMADGMNHSEAKGKIAQYDMMLPLEDVLIYVKHFADNGEAEDMSRLADMYYNGVGTDVDYEKAFDYYKKASKLDVVDSHIGMAQCYYHGRGVDCDYESAFDYFTKGSKGGNSVAVSGLGECYYYGYGVEQDYEKAFELFTKANNGSNGVALHGLAMCYYNGYGVAQNESRAVKTFLEALELDKYRAGVSLGDHYASTHLSEDDIKAKSFYKMASEAGNPEAQNKLGVLIYNLGVTYQTITVSKDETRTVPVLPSQEVVSEASEWFKMSADQKYFNGMYNYAYSMVVLLDSSNIIGSQAGKDAVKLFRSLAADGHKEAMMALSNYCFYDIGIDLNEACQWCTIAAEEAASEDDRGAAALYLGVWGCLVYDNAEALSTLEGEDLATMQAQGVEIMERAASSGCRFVYSRIYNYYRTVKRDRATAKLWDKQIEMLTKEQMAMPEKVAFRQ